MTYDSNFFVSFSDTCTLKYFLRHFLAEKNPDGEDYDDYESENEPGKVEPKVEPGTVDIPEFISTNRSYNAVIGSDLTLACQVNKLLEETQVYWQM